MSTFLYLVYVDELLQAFTSSKYGAKVMSFKCNSPAFADDISLLAISPYLLAAYSVKWTLYMITVDSGT